jgi:alcohol dehydrogenase class IV
VKWEFAAPTRIVFGEGTLWEAPGLAAELGTRVLVVQGSSGRAEPLIERLRTGGLVTTTLSVPGEPTIERIEQGVEHARRERCGVVVALGGGSVIDAGKAIAALLTNPGEPRDYLEVIGRGRALVNRSAPMIAIPTTAGTGAEVTRNAVLGARDERVKVSLRSPLMLPTVALVDPELTYGLPPAITASTGLDALTQCIEPFVTPRATPLSDAVAREGMRRAAGALLRACDDGSDTGARYDMAVASLCGGLALANAKLGAVHGFAAPLGGMFPIPHGVACARLLAPVAEHNVRALRQREPHSPALARYDEVARVLTGRDGARAEDAVRWLAETVERLGIPRLSAYGIADADVAAVADRTGGSSSMQGNPVAFTREELEEVLRAAM